MKNKIAIVSFTAALIQEDCTQGGNEGVYYYDAQQGALISYLVSKFPKAIIDLIGFSTNFEFRVRDYEKYRVIQLPNFNCNNLIILSILFNLSSFFYLFKCRPSVVYAYTTGLFYPYLGALFYAKLLRVPFFVNLRNLPYSLYFDKSIPLYKRVGVKVTDKICMKYSDVVIVHKEIKELFKSNLKLYQKSLVLQSCSQNIFLKPKRNKNIESKELTFATWSVISKTRRLDIAIRGFAKAKELNEGVDAKFFIIGDGDDLENLKKLVKKLKTSDIIFKGYMQQGELCKFLQGVSVAVIPIAPDKVYHQLSSPIKLAEAIALELPMIASDIEPNQIVKERNLGIICEHDADSYAQAFLKFWSFSDSDLNKFGRNCKKVKHLFTPENVFKDVGGAIAQYISAD